MVEVAGEIDGPGKFDIKIPSGYVEDKSMAPLRRWTRGSDDPIVELDSGPTELGGSCPRDSSDEALAGGLGREKDIHICGSDTGVYVRRFVGGDDPLTCLITYPTKVPAEGDRVHAGIAICESLQVDRHVLTADPHALRPDIARSVRVNLPSLASAEVELRLPAHYVRQPNTESVLFSHAVNHELPNVFIVGLDQPMTCEGRPQLGGPPGNIAFCEDALSLLVMLSVPVSHNELVGCRIYIPRGQRNHDGTTSPFPADVMEQRKKDAITICDSVKVRGVEQIGGPTK